MPNFLGFVSHFGVVLFKLGAQHVGRPALQPPAAPLPPRPITSSTSTRSPGAQYQSTTTTTTSSTSTGSSFLLLPCCFLGLLHSCSSPCLFTCCLSSWLPSTLPCLFASLLASLLPSFRPWLLSSFLACFLLAPSHPCLLGSWLACLLAGLLCRSSKHDLEMKKQSPKCKQFPTRMQYPARYQVMLVGVALLVISVFPPLVSFPGRNYGLQSSRTNPCVPRWPYSSYSTYEAQSYKDQRQSYSLLATGLRGLEHPCHIKTFGRNVSHIWFWIAWSPISMIHGLIFLCIWLPFVQLPLAYCKCPPSCKGRFRVHPLPMPDPLSATCHRCSRHDMRIHIYTVHGAGASKGWLCFDSLFQETCQTSLLKVPGFKKLWAILATKSLSSLPQPPNTGVQGAPSPRLLSVFATVHVSVRVFNNTWTCETAPVSRQPCPSKTGRNGGRTCSLTWRFDQASMGFPTEARADPSAGKCKTHLGPETVQSEELYEVWSQTMQRFWV